jgi:hypothetical protein
MLRRVGAVLLIMIACGLAARPARSQSPAPPAPITPAVLGFAPVGSVHGRLTVMGDYAYVYAGTNSGWYDNASPRMDVFAIADPAMPRLTATYTAPSYITRIAATPTHLYVGTTQHGLRVLSLADPRHPVEVGAFTTFAAVLDVTLGPGYLLIAAERDGLRVLSLADPARPAEIGAITWPTYATYGWVAEGVEVSGARAYVSGYSVRSWIFRSVFIIDLRDPTRPTDISAQDPFELSGEYVMAVRDGYAYVRWYYGPWISVADLRDPDALTTTAYLKVEGEGVATAGALFGQYLYVGCDGGLDPVNGVNVVDVADPAAPTIVGAARAGGRRI